MFVMNLNETTELTEDYLKGKSIEQLDDCVIIPTLTLTKEDHHHNKLNKKQKQFLFQNTRILVEDITKHTDSLIANNNSNQQPNDDAKNNRPANSTNRPLILCIPTQDKADEIAALILKQLLNKHKITTKILPYTKLLNKCMQKVEE